MKKLIAITCSLFAFAALAAFDVTALSRTVPVLPPQTIEAAATNSAIFTATSLKGIAGIELAADAGAYGRTMELSLFTTNAASGGWTALTRRTIANSNAFVTVVGFPALVATPVMRVEVSSTANSTVSATLLSF